MTKIDNVTSIQFLDSSGRSLKHYPFDCPVVIDIARKTVTIPSDDPFILPDIEDLEIYTPGLAWNKMVIHRNGQLGEIVVLYPLPVNS